MGIPATFELESSFWLRRLRLSLAVGVAVAVFFGQFFSASFSEAKMLLILAVYAIWILGAEWHERRHGRQLMFFEFCADLTAITALFWSNGGSVNPFINSYLLIVLVGGLFLSTLFTVLLSAFAGICVFLLAYAPMSPGAAGVLPALTASRRYGISVGLIVLIFISCCFTSLFLARLGRAQDQLRQAAKVGALGRLVAGLAHELGTPLNSILVLAGELKGRGAGSVEKTSELIASQARRCGEIVALLMGTSWPVGGMQELGNPSVNLKEWVESVYASLLEMRGDPGIDKVAPGIDFRVECQGLPVSLPLPIFVLRQVLENLFRNAFEALKGRQDGRIRVMAIYGRQSDELQLIVEDNGPGFSKEARNRAFEAFFSTKQRERPGYGLGLYISYYLLSQVGGKIVIDSQKGPGAKLRISLPILPDSEPVDALMKEGRV